MTEKSNKYYHIELLPSMTGQKKDCKLKSNFHTQIRTRIIVMKWKEINTQIQKRQLIPEKKQNYITIKENIVEIQNFEPLLCYIGVVTTNTITHISKFSHTD